jgi:hypothetical protein
MLLGNSNLWLNLREIQINSVLLIGQLELFITKKRLYPVLFFKRYCFQLSPRITHCKFDPRVLGHPVYRAFFLTVAIGNCMVKLIPPVNFCSDENIQTIFGTKLEDFLNYRKDYNSIS